MAGEGTLYQRKSGDKWYLIISTGERKPNGRYKQKWIDLETTDKNIAKEKKKIALADIQKKGRYDQPSKELFSDWLVFWLEEIKRNKLKPKTYDDYEYIIRIHIKPEIGGYRLKELTPEILQRFYNSKRIQKKLSPKSNTSEQLVYSDESISLRTLQKVKMITGSALRAAVAMKKIPENPNLYVEVEPYERPEVNYILPEDMPDFLEFLSTDRWYAAFVTDLGSGLRRGELAALRWNDFIIKKTPEGDAGYLRIDESLVPIKTHQKDGPKTKLVIQSPKTKKSKRIVPIPSDVTETLKKWRLQKKEECMGRGEKIKETDFIFTWEDGRIIHPDYLTHHFSKLANKYGCKGITLHKLRHSYATMLLEKGEDLKIIQENLGDSTMAVVSDIYTHVVDKLKERAAHKIEGFTKKKSG